LSFDRYLNNLAIVRVTVEDLELMTFAHKRTMLDKTINQFGRTGNSLWTSLSNATEVALSWGWQVTESGLALIDSSKLRSSLMLVAADGMPMTEGQTLAYELAKVGALPWRQQVLDLCNPRPEPEGVAAPHQWLLLAYGKS
jgi:hypothetical protein